MTFLLVKLSKIKFLIKLKDKANVCAIQGQSLFNGLLHRVLLRLCEVLESPDLAVVGGEILERIPVAVLDALDTSVLDKSLAGLLI